MTEVTWTLIYGWLLMITLMKGGMDTGKDHKTDLEKWLVSSLAGLILLIPLYIAYAAGAFVAVTGYAGSMGWFGIWISLHVVGFIKLTYDAIVESKLTSLVLAVLGYFVLYQMGAYANFSNF